MSCIDEHSRSEYLQAIDVLKMMKFLQESNLGLDGLSRHFFAECPTEFFLKSLPKFEERFLFFKVIYDVEESISKTDDPFFGFYLDVPDSMIDKKAIERIMCENDPYLGEIMVKWHKEKVYVEAVGDALMSESMTALYTHLEELERRLEDGKNESIHHAG